jgi:hypothetical protein
MTALPASSDFTGSSQTEGQAKAFVAAQRDYLAGLLGTDGTVATALAALGVLGAGYAAKTSAYTVVTADRGKVIACSGTWTLALPAAATAASGFSVLAINTSTGIITVDPSGAETVDGATSLELRPGHGVLLICTGSAWVTLAMPRAQARAADIARSEASNLFPDFDMVDEAFYASSTGGSVLFTANATSTLGARYAYLAPNASAHSMESDWFPIEPSTEYQVSGACLLSTATAGSGTMTLLFETGSLDASGVVTSLGTSTVGTRTDVFNTALFSVAVTTGSTARRGRFVGQRAAGGTAQGRMAGLKVQKLTTQAMMATGVVTTSTTDDTTGRLSRIGDFGHGRTVALTGATLLKDRTLRPGFYTYNTGSITDGPEVPAFAHTLIVMQTTSAVTGSDQRRTFLSMRATGSGNHRLWIGSQGSDEATPGAITWSQVYGQRGILATVSQSSGVPTGGLIERGSNANGEYVRFADGTLICTHSLAASSGAAATWTFPSSFIAAPVVTGAATATVSSVVVLDAAPSTTAATFSARDKTDARRADTCRLIAVGRWF